MNAENTRGVCMPTADELEKLSEHILDIATRMDFYGGFGVMGDRGRYLIFCGKAVGQWAGEVKLEAAV
ncbi:MAG: hypothetical protein CTY26_06055 [Methylophilus sp.]|nr:MAG: hypothetical protein CTY26_06055 [Methylophilus sp.]